MKKLYSLFMCTLAAFSAPLAADSTNFIRLSDAKQFPDLLKNDKVVALFVYPPGQPCKNMTTTALKVAQEDTTTIFVLIDIRTFGDLRNQYHVGGLPTLILFRNGIERTRTTGQRDANSLKTLIAKTFLGTRRAIATHPVAYIIAWIKSHFTTNPVCENE